MAILREVRKFRHGATFAILVSISVSMAGASITYSIAAQGRDRVADQWTTEERETIRSLGLSSLSPLPRDPSNKFADDARAAAFGEQLFFDTRLSANGKVSCATCHEPSRDFQDGTALAKGVGTTTRRTMPIAGTAYSPWLFWDGRTDSQWAQALGPLESAVEHGGTRAQYAHTIAANYQQEYEALFGTLPKLSDVPLQAGPNGDRAARIAWQRLSPVRQNEISRLYANLGKAIAAFERRIGFQATRFDRWVEAEFAGAARTPESSMTRDEVAGLRLFIGKGSCVNCHNGARFTDDHFHNTGVAARADLPPDSGRATGAPAVLSGEFNCLSQYSDAKADDCGELRFTSGEGPELVRAYKTPSLRNVARHAPYMHAGQIATLTDVVTHYNRALKARVGHSELKALGLSAEQRRQIEAFLHTLTSEEVTPSASYRVP